MQQTEVDATFQPLGAFNILLVNMPAELVNLFNDYIDDNSKELNSLSDRLVGQIRQNPKSSQLDIPIDDEFGAVMKNFLNGMGTSYVRQGYDGGATAECYELWSNDSYEGDYQPLHMHGSRTPAGLSGFAYLEVPPQIAAGPPGHSVNHKNAAGESDGYTQLVWGTTNAQDIMMMKPQTSTFIKPTKGLLVMFPNWLYHQVHPFFGEGCRRTFAFNCKVNNSREFLEKFGAVDVI
tara:strand:- start:968 stop:1672 length:705 start_codon:yes stop_codon:yes gene_type:complete